jgi:hypothetical protein
MKKNYKQKNEITHLEEIYGPEWAEILISSAGMTLPGWRRSFTAAELRSTFMRLQQLYLLEHENTRLRSERASAWAALEAAEDRAEYYHRQLILESRYAAIVQRIAA